ncbi:hypothetical protein KDH_52850 [Dictyobacter sp. S3.2.2.5]|uniref:Uncharacterized protein n=1 Tax=Dictyobacter halimunensis TaxID=3026934 RepID=A0ABQ6FW18_9CHLR|nr:hypothetical protein KDH_52850 [Dictyobacter sp. S3.2.2.5]
MLSAAKADKVLPTVSHPHITPALAWFDMRMADLCVNKPTMAPNGGSPLIPQERRKTIVNDQEVVFHIQALRKP